MRATNTLVLGENRALYIGELPATGMHRHASPVLLIGLSGRFAVRLPWGVVHSCHSAVIDAGVEHSFDPCGERVALMYLEPDSVEARALRFLFRTEGPVLCDAAVRVASRSSIERHLAAFDLQALLPKSCTGLVELDRRVEESLRYVRRKQGELLTRDRAADAIHLSASRFNHVFRDQTGVSFRSYRVWSQVRSALMAFGPHGSLTDAALHGAFADSSHFSRTFRKTFGMTPSSVLKPLKTITLL